MSLGALAQRSGLSKTILARIEAGQGNPALETLWRVAGALDVPLGSLLGEGEPPRTRLIRAGEGERIHSEAGFLARLVLAEGRAHRTEIYEFELASGVDYRSMPHAPGTEELVLCLSGRMRVGPVGDDAELGPLDALWFPADLPHHYAAGDPGLGLNVMSYPPATGAARGG